MMVMECIELLRLGNVKAKSSTVQALIEHLLAKEENWRKQIHFKFSEDNGHCSVTIDDNMIKDEELPFEVRLGLCFDTSRSIIQEILEEAVGEEVKKRNT